MAPCAKPFRRHTTNGGYPAHQNLYQAVKGMSAGAQIIAEGGLIVIASRCNDGFSKSRELQELLFDHASPQAILDTISRLDFRCTTNGKRSFRRWFASKRALRFTAIFRPPDVRRAYLEPIDDIAKRVAGRTATDRQDAPPIAVLPEDR